jgi:hypothetical protein
MSEWWTYTLSDFLMFSPRTYYRLFELYNLAVWPGQLLALVCGAAILALWWGGGSWAGRLVAAILAAAWAWVAGGYLLTRYDDINWAARSYAVGFLIQALLLTWTGVVSNRLALRRAPGLAPQAGLALLLFGLAYPLLAPLLGRPWTQAEVFALAPDPTVVATLGVLLAASRRPGLLFVVPLLWCVVSGATLWTMGSPEAPVLPAAAVLTLAVAACTRAAAEQRHHDTPRSRADEPPRRP